MTSHRLFAIPVIALAAGCATPDAAPAATSPADPMNINYFGPPGTFQQVSFLDVVSGK